MLSKNNKLPLNKVGRLFRIIFKVTLLNILLFNTSKKKINSQLIKSSQMKPNKSIIHKKSSISDIHNILGIPVQYV